MKTKGMQLRSAAHAAVLAALLAAPLAASAAGANGGVIRFVGAIVAPPLQIRTAALPMSGGIASATGQGFARTVTFSAPPGAAGGADVALEVDGKAPPAERVTARFVDGNGRVGAARNGHYPVNRSGGVLSLNAKRTDVDTRVTLVVSYE
ncbi:hypothetical protein LJ656_17125 [Paraburkholderia sp. MMS20-SJTR3]|uniref:DUF4402 domain-containing protein n=1 Tax=Paraburkholderia sejongensis TaxID=2886946 RepID=A0ABS8JWN4_9BURK|nr:hypothetical protein [Paraburkholderia sp. MMS20-SJTR3]MCC8394321.1 hypothetical protein [Paraburkholderia sp. MMS20-SJTR3]